MNNGQHLREKKGIGVIGSETREKTIQRVKTKKNDYSTGCSEDVPNQNLVLRKRIKRGV